jgi:hypothetical protein
MGRPTKAMSNGTRKRGRPVSADPAGLRSRACKPETVGPQDGSLRRSALSSAPDTRR